MRAWVLVLALSAAAFVAGAVMTALAATLTGVPARSLRTAKRTATELLASAYDYWEYARSNAVVEGGLVTSWTSTKHALVLQPTDAVANALATSASPNGTLGVKTQSDSYLVKPTGASWSSWPRIETSNVRTVAFVASVGAANGDGVTFEEADAKIYCSQLSTSAYNVNDLFTVENDLACGSLGGNTQALGASAVRTVVVSSTYRNDTNAGFRSYVDGALAKQTTLSSPQISLSEPIVSVGLVANTHYTGTVYFVGVWDTDMSDAEHAALAARLRALYIDALPPPVLSYGVTYTLAYVGTPLTLTLQNTGGALQGDVTCNVDVATATGLTLDPISGVISGTPTLTYSGTLTVSASNTGGTATTQLTLVIQPSAANDPVIRYNPSNVITAYLGAQLSPTYTIVSTGLTTPTAYAIDPALPAGLAFSTTTGAISGTPMEVSDWTTYEVTGTAAENAGTAIVTLTVVDAEPPATPLIQVADGNLQRVVYFNYAIDPITFVNAGGETVTNYAISPDITATLGLQFDPRDGTISGTPTMLQTEAQAFTVSVTGPGGNSQTVFAVRCILRHKIVYASDALTFTQGERVSEFPRYVDVTTGKAVDSVPAYLVGAAYRLEDAIAPIDGIAVDAATGEIRGTPTATSAQQLWRVVAATAAVSVDATLSVRCDGTFSFAGARGLRTGTKIKLTPVFSAQAPVAIVTGPQWPAFLSVFSKTFAVSGQTDTPGTITLDCTAYFADGAQAKCAQKATIVRAARTTSSGVNAPLLYAGAASMAAGVLGALSAAAVYRVGKQT